MNHTPDREYRPLALALIAIVFVLIMILIIAALFGGRAV